MTKPTPPPNRIVRDPLSDSVVILIAILVAVAGFLLWVGAPQ